MTKTNQLSIAENKPASQMQVMKNYFSSDSVKARFNEILGKKSQGFVASILQVVSQNDHLKNVDPASIYQAAMMAATLDLPINNNLGQAYIIPYKGQAQFQMGYKGYIQLAQRSGLFKTISASQIYEGQLIEENPLTGFLFDFKAKKSDKIIGYASYFELLNGFNKTLYMSGEELKKHGAKFSQTFKNGKGLWADDFNAMAIKTVLKLLLSKYAPLSIEMQKAVISDQSVINDSETLDVEYVDNTEDFKTSIAESEMNKLINEIKSAGSVEELESLGTIPDQLIDLYNEKMEFLK